MRWGSAGKMWRRDILRDQGYKILERNFRCEVGEVDIIARDGRTLVFAEVKTREHDDPTPEDQVNQVKTASTDQGGEVLSFAIWHSPATGEV